MIIRLAKPSDAADMTALLNEIIAAGGTTAHQRPFDDQRMQTEYIAPEMNIACHVAEIDGRVAGFQSLVRPGPETNSELVGWAYIATFVAQDVAGKGVGQHLFAATRASAQAAGVETIDATIRADNVPGLRYYSGLGFQDYDRLNDVPLRDGTRIDRLRKRYDLPQGDDPEKSKLAQL
ncbi:GNAT family N-acetyltransferase [Cognatiyoonia sp. IB215446]|uniref:GNAT family N-acetyltransferase n=1 Tax=Cognatiyoonia sp. IB215446 TaxID=3097355 RepID=UPI002A0C8BB9|nr:GNAT family N-acetyltransferase [Cognatiyoonia sp. IB215446]MDX8349326.1 GNAT family N-acetyltransferase [Cognatiyoonia sp. IB215446]